MLVRAVRLVVRLPTAPPPTVAILSEVTAVSGESKVVGVIVAVRIVTAIVSTVKPTDCVVDGSVWIPGIPKRGSSTETADTG